MLIRLLYNKSSNTLKITTLVHDATKAKIFQTLGVKAAVGSNSDIMLLQQLAADADVVFACVSDNQISLFIQIDVCVCLG